MTRRVVMIVLVVLLSISYVWGQEADSSLLNLERLYSTSEFSQERFGPARWIDDGKGYTTLERSEGEHKGRDIVRYESKSGKREIIVPAARLVPEGDSTVLRISNYEWSEDKSRLLVFTNTKRVWRLNTRGDYYVLNLKNWKLEKLGGEAKPSTLMFAKFSADGKKVAYVRENNLYVEDVESHEITQLTFDGSTTIINGTFDWVYEEEFHMRDGFRWSPDGEHIAYWQLDAEGVGEFYMINNTDSLYSKIIPVQYPKAGTTNSACRVGVVSSKGGETTWFKVPGDPRNNYICRMEWADNSDEIIIQHMNRLQNKNEVMLGDIKTGEMKTIFVDEEETWLDAVDDWKWMDNGRYFTWVTQRDGWRHVYLISRSGEEVKAITPWDFDVVSILNIDDKAGWLYYIASPDNPLQRYLYRSRLDGSGEAERLTPMELPGWHSYQVAPNSKWAIHTYSSANKPPVIDFVELPKHKVKRTLVDNAKLKARVERIKKLPREFFRVDNGEGVKLDCYMIKPYNFDPTKKYPVLFHVYGEPWGQTVQDRWGGSGYLWHVLLAQQGYIIMSVDNRGTPSPRGREWRKCVYGKIGILASQDQAAAVKEIGKWDFVDEDRIAIWGWSGGGSMTLNMLFRYPDLYHVGMSVAPVSDQRYYDTIYQERYQGLPDVNAECYTNGSPITFAHQLKGKLLLVHGTGDDNVHYQNSEAVVNALIRHNKIFSFMAYPNRSHGIYEGKNTSRHLRELLTWYLHENLPAGPLPQ